MTKPRIIAVLGMHRSGTSAIARGLKALGVNLGDNLMPAVEGDNEKGFWEDLDFYRFNERLLLKSGSTWNNLSLIDASRLAREEFSAERYEATALIENKIASSKVFGFKDPRTALLLPFWRCIFDDLGVDDNYLIALRNPLEVAESLRKRNQLDFAHGATLWLKYSWASVKHSADRKRVCVSYSRLLADPAAELARAATAFDLEMPSRSSALYKEYADEFLTQSLRRNKISDNELGRSSTIPRIVPELYGHLKNWADAAPDQELSLPEDLSGRIDAFWSMCEPLLHLGDRLHASSADAKTKLAQAEKARADLNKQVGTLKAADAQLQQDLAGKNAEFTTQSQRLAALTGQIAKWEADNASRDKALTEARAQIQAGADKLAQAEKNRAELLKQIETLKAAEAQLRQQSEAQATLNARIAEVESGKAASDKALADTRAQLQAGNEKLAQADKNRSELVKQIETLKAAEAQLQKNLADSRAEIQAQSEKLTAVAARIAELDADKALADQALADTGAQLQAGAAKLAEQEREIAALKAALAAAETDKSAKERELLSVREDLKSEQAGRASVSEELAEKTKSLRLLRHDFTQHEEAAKATAAESKERISGLESALSTLQQSLAQAKDQAKSAHEMLSAKDSHLAELEKKLAQAQAELSQARAEIKAKSDEINTRGQRITQIDAQKAASEKALAGKESELKALAEKSAQQETRIAELGTAISSVNASKSSVEEELATARNSVKSLQESIGSLKSELFEKTKGLRLARYDFAQQIDAAKSAEAEAKAQITDLQSRLAAQSKAVAERDAQITSLNKAIEKSSIDIAERDEKLKAADLEKSQFVALVSAAQAKSNMLQSALGEKEDQLNLAYDERQQLRAEMLDGLSEASRRTNLAEADARRSQNELSSAWETIRVLNNDLSTLRFELEQSHTQLTNEFARTSEIDQRVKDAEFELASRNTALAEAERLVTNLQHDLSEKTKVVRLLRHEVAELRSSTSWRLTKPVRMTRSLLTKPRQLLIRFLRNGGGGSGIERP